MAKVNIFYVFSAVCALIFIGYLWLVLLPMYAGTDAYHGMRSMVILISSAMGVVVVITLLMARLPPSK